MPVMHQPSGLILYLSDLQRPVPKSNLKALPLLLPVLTVILVLPAQSSTTSAKFRQNSSAVSHSLSASEGAQFIYPWPCRPWAVLACWIIHGALGLKLQCLLLVLLSLLSSGVILCQSCV